MFPDVNMIPSEEFASMEADSGSSTSDSNIVLVDVRTKAERDVSIVEGAVHVSELDVTRLPSNAHLVTYCTVGFRACLEAKRLKQQYKSLQVSCLDGIACYTHVLPSKMNIRRIVEPATGKPANIVHTYGNQWSCVNRDHFKATHFSPLLFAAYNVQFGASTAWQMIKGKFR